MIHHRDQKNYWTDCITDHNWMLRQIKTNGEIRDRDKDVLLTEPVADVERLLTRPISVIIIRFPHFLPADKVAHRTSTHHAG